MQNSLLWLVLLVALMYFMMIRPQQKQKKQREQLLGSLKKGDEIVTIGGIHGKIVSLTDDSIVLEISHKVRITLQRSAVGNIKQKDEEDEDANEAVNDSAANQPVQLPENTGDEETGAK